MTAVIQCAGLSGIVESAVPGHPHRRSCCFSPADESKSLHMAGASALATSLTCSYNPARLTLCGVCGGAGVPGQSFKLLDRDSQSTGTTPSPHPLSRLGSPESNLTLSLHLRGKGRHSEAGRISVTACLSHEHTAGIGRGPPTALPRNTAWGRILPQASPDFYRC